MARILDFELILLSITEFDVILGMHWLGEYCADRL